MIETYKKRLLKDMVRLNNVWRASDFAANWKRSAWEVGQAAQQLKLAKKIKIDKDGVLSLR